MQLIWTEGAHQLCGRRGKGLLIIQPAMKYSPCPRKNFASRSKNELGEKCGLVMNEGHFNQKNGSKVVCITCSGSGGQRDSEITALIIRTLTIR